MTAQELLGISFPQGRAFGLVLKAGITQAEAQALMLTPQDYLNHSKYGQAATLLAQSFLREQRRLRDQPLAEALPYRVYGPSHGIIIEVGAIAQMTASMRLPISRAGAIMPDGHQGYGLPIGGVLGTYKAVIPFGVGVDIGCGMNLSVLNISLPYSGGDPREALRAGVDMAELRARIVGGTVFGAGQTGPYKDADHPFADHPLWNEVEREVLGWRRTALDQLGTSGSGNHFVEFGAVVLGDQPDRVYLALLSHSGGRALAARTAKRYTEIAEAERELPKEFQKLAWLELDTPQGQAYWNAMSLAGAYSAANHEVIHQQVLGDWMGLRVEHSFNAHNLAWRETHGGEELIVHRKGATPAGLGVRGVIPGTMGDVSYLVEGLGNPDSLHSSSHGAGRAMSRTVAERTFAGLDLNEVLRERGVELISGGLDEHPGAYKPIGSVMAAQRDLVRERGTFWPMLVKMDEAATDNHAGDPSLGE